MNKPKILAAAAVTAAAVGTLAIAGCSGGQQNSQQVQQQTTEQYAQKLNNAEPYPIGQMNDSAERANLRERLVRMNDPHKIGYVTEMTQNGQVIAHYTIKGKISSMGSQLSNTHNILGLQSAPAVVDSMGDDGSYGPEECAQYGIFFFDTAGGMHEWCSPYWNYSDVPEDPTSKPLLTADANAKPSSTAGMLK